MKYRAYFLLLCVGLFTGCGDDGSVVNGGNDATASGSSSDGGIMAPTDGMASPLDNGPPDAQPVDSETRMDSNQVQIETSLGVFVIELDFQASPNTAANFLEYVDAGFFDGADGMGATTFHRIISGFMVQGGGILENGQRKQTRAPIAHESPNGLNNLRGTVAMARTSDPNSATSQFFVNHVDNPFLDYVSPQEPGYVVFGRVIEGMDVIDDMAAVATGANDVPISTILILEASRR